MSVHAHADPRGQTFVNSFTSVGVCEMGYDICGYSSQKGKVNGERERKKKKQQQHLFVNVYVIQSLPTSVTSANPAFSSRCAVPTYQLNNNGCPPVMDIIWTRPMFCMTCISNHTKPAQNICSSDLSLERESGVERCQNIWFCSVAKKACPSSKKKAKKKKST